MAARKDAQSVSPFQSLVHWLRLKNYQYEVTFSLYMLTYTEKIVFNTILLTLISLLLTAAFFYLPNHLFIIYSRVWYYISGEFVTHAGANALNRADTLGDVLDVLKAAKEIVTTNGAGSSITQKIVKETIAAVRGEL